MKKLVLTAIAGFAATLTQAQVVVTESDFASPGDVLYIGRDTLVTGNISLGSTGSGQTWNFTGLGFDVLDTINFVDPSGLPNYAEFPASNISFKQMGGDAYVEKSASGVRLLGFAGQIMGAPFPVSAPVTPSQTLIQFPSQVGVSFDDTSQIDVTVDISAFGGSYGVDSARFKRNFYTQHNIDADGSITIPLGTYNAVRDRIDETTIDTVWIYSPSGNPLFGIQQGWQLVPDLVAQFIGLDGAVTTGTTRNYRFYGPNSKFYIVDITTDESDAPITARYQVDPNTLSVKDEVYNNNAISIFPNPAADHFNVMVTNLKGKATIALFDATGRQVSSAMLNANQNEVSTNGLTNGMYLYRVADENGNLVKTGKLLIAK